MKKELRSYLKKVITEKERTESELRKKIKEATTADEVRSLGETLDAILSELKEAKQQLDSEPEDTSGDSGDTGATTSEEEGRSGNLKGDIRGGINTFSPIAAYSQLGAGEQRNKVAVLDSMEYRTAFMEYVQTGKWDYKGELRADEFVSTEEMGKAIPNTIFNEFIQDVKKIYGQLYARVRKMNIKGGVEIPIEELKPSVRWITETTVSETQKAPEIKTSIKFAYYIAEAKISQTLLSNIVSLPVLESEIARLLAEAFIKEFDRFIMKGTGVGQPLGILNDTRVPKENVIYFTDEEMRDWTRWRKELFAKIPLAYISQGIMILTNATWESNIMTLKDKNDRPLYYETYDPTGNSINRRFNGKEVMLVEPDIVADFDTSEDDSTFGVFFNPNDYAINSNMQLGFKRWFDEDKNKYINKGLMITDGKLIDPKGVYILKKGTAPTP